MKREKRKMLDLVLDKSGSMSGWKIEMEKEIFMEKLEDTVSGNDSVGVIAFDTNVEEIHPLKRFTNASKEEMKDRVGKLRADGNTALYDAIAHSIDRLVDVGRDYKLIVLCLTDGDENSSVRFKTTDELIKYAKSKGVDLEIVLIGLGDRVNEVALRTITEGIGGTYIPARETSEDMGRAVAEAGRVIRNGGAQREDPEESIGDTIRLPSIYDRCTMKTSGGSIIMMNNYDLGDKKKMDGNGIRFSGGRRREEMEYMETIAGRASSLLDEHVMPFSTGSVVVPVYVWEPRRFERVFGVRTIPSRYCKELYSRLPFSDAETIHCEFDDHHERFPSGDIVGKMSDMGPCIGEPVAVFVTDMMFGKMEDEWKHMDGPSCPGIYLKDLSDDGPTGDINMRCAMSYMAVSSTVYYSTSRISALTRRELSDMDSLLCGTLSMLCSDDRTLDRFVSRCTLIGTSMYPLHLLKALKKNPYRGSLNKLLLKMHDRFWSSLDNKIFMHRYNQNFLKLTLWTLFNELPVFETLTGTVNRGNEEKYFQDINRFLEDFRGRLL